MVEEDGNYSGMDRLNADKDEQEGTESMYMIM